MIEITIHIVATTLMMVIIPTVMKITPLNEDIMTGYTTKPITMCTVVPEKETHILKDIRKELPSEMTIRDTIQEEVVM